MAICKFFQRGTCRYGENCRNEHPKSTPFFAAGNRFGALQQESGGGRFDATRDDKETENKYGVTKTDIQNDLTPGKNRPEWIFSCYAPGKSVPIHLFGGPQREQSFEEMRVAHYAAAASGTAETAIQEANKMYAEAEQQMKTVLNDLDGAVRYILNGEYDHPNRFDIMEGKTTPVSSTGAFGKPQTAAQPSPFGQPSAPTQTPGFGQPAFGQPTSFGQPTPTPGNQSGFGQPAFPQSQPGGGFGQPTPSPFAQSSSQTKPGGFGQFSNQQTPAFGQPSANPSPFTQDKPTVSPFAQAAPAAPAPSPFGAPAPQTNSPFGQPAPFASPAAPVTATQPKPTPTATTKTAYSLIVEKSLNGMPNLSGQTAHNPTTKKLTTWKGQPVTYLSEDNPCYPHPNDPSILVHIFCPDGPPAAATLKDAQAEDKEYTPEVEAAYKYAKQNGQFKDGVIPKVPPKTEWCSFDL